MTAAAPDFLPRMIAEKGRHIIGGVPEGYRALVISDLARFHGDRCVYVARDAARWPACLGHLVFRARPAIVEFPAWDCLPDRLSPQPMASATRMATLARLPALRVVPILCSPPFRPSCICATTRADWRARFSSTPGQDLDTKHWWNFCRPMAHSRGSTGWSRVTLPCAAVIDLFPPGSPQTRAIGHVRPDA
ncbi:MAG: hypothetical protein CM15mP21_8390 [Hyphomicrobiales bacterium]|nr:MAG: hypothetical protein CM15mP21_8390 [Hyphomicrobiales bacterium]